MGIMEGLNPEQRRAVMHFEGPELILAGAGSGKTRVLTNRIAWLIREKEVNPWNILAITFTNKAADEMRERVEKIVGFGADSVWVATFHSTCGRILRRFAEGIGYGTNFAIYDTDDQKSVMKDVCRRLNIETKIYKEKMFLSAISSAKDELIYPAEYAKFAAGNPDTAQIARVYEEYQRTLKKSNAMDFDDMIGLTVRLFRECPDVLESYRRRFRFIMVDEYQDTNTAQFEQIRLLSGENGNLCVVGDDDQSIYRFRGANIRNILSFEECFPGAAVFRLEQNYRSTPSILNTANAVIANNTGRKEKSLWTENPDLARTRLVSLPSAYEEAEYVVKDIAVEAAAGRFRYGDCAVLYRTNAQSRLLEEKLLMAGMPYRIVGGIQFYARKEIKDLLGYLKVVDNPDDEVAVRRIINVPKRGIGAASMQKAEIYAAVNDIPLYRSLAKAKEIPGMGRGAGRIEGFVKLCEDLREKAAGMGVRELLEEIIRRIGYVEELQAEGTQEAKDRLDNIDELISKVAAYEEGTAEASLGGFLQEVSLVSDTDSLDEKQGVVMLMTIHSAKGLEFPRVYLTGMEEGLFPSYQSITSDDWEEALEEERRLCYVGMTRAKKALILTHAQIRMFRGERRMNSPSRFIDEIPTELLDIRDGFGARKEQTSWGDRTGSYPPGGGYGKEQTSWGDRTGSYQSGSGSRHEGHRQGSGARPGALLREKPFISAGRDMQKADTLPYGVGDRVSHVKFGTGTVTGIRDAGRDYEVTVEFDGVGVRKMFAAFAKLKRCR